MAVVRTQAAVVQSCSVRTELTRWSWSTQHLKCQCVYISTRYMLLRCLGRRKRKRDDHTLSYADALAKTASESTKVIERKQRILFAGFVGRMGEVRLP